MRAATLWVLLGALALGNAFADVVVPADRVQQGVSIRAQPTSQSTFLGLLRPGESLPYEASVPRWHRVRLSDGSPAFVSKSWTQVVPD